MGRKNLFYFGLYFGFGLLGTIILGMAFLTFKNNLSGNLAFTVSGQAPPPTPTVTPTPDYKLTNNNRLTHYVSDSKKLSLDYPSGWILDTSLTKSKNSLSFLVLKNQDIVITIVVDETMPFGFAGSNQAQTSMKLTLDNGTVLSGNKFVNTRSGSTFVSLGTATGRQVSVQIVLPSDKTDQLPAVENILRTLNF